MSLAPGVQCIRTKGRRYGAVAPWYDCPVQRFAHRAITAIQLTRLSMAFAAVSDLWFVILLSRANNDYSYIEVYKMPLWGGLLAGAVVAIGLFAYGAALNDVLDARHDSAFSPERPIPAGRIRLGQAIVVTISSLLVAVFGSAFMGEPALHVTVLIAAGILFFNAAGRFIPSVGLVTIGLIHAAHMLIPNVQLTFTLPIWLVMTHAIVIAAAIHVLEEKRPRLTVKTIIGIAIGWAVWSTIILAAPWLLAREAPWPPDVPVWHVVWPVMAIVGFVSVAWWKTTTVPPRVAAEKLRRYGAMWQCLYGASWLLALGLLREAMIIGIVAFLGFAGMTILKEMTTLVARPVMYRG